MFLIPFCISWIKAVLEYRLNGISSVFCGCQFVCMSIPHMPGECHICKLSDICLPKVLLAEAAQSSLCIYSLCSVLAIRYTNSLGCVNRQNTSTFLLATILLIVSPHPYRSKSPLITSLQRKFCN